MMDQGNNNIGTASLVESFPDLTFTDHELTFVTVRAGEPGGVEPEHCQANPVHRERLRVRQGQGSERVRPGEGGPQKVVIWHQPVSEHLAFFWVSDNLRDDLPRRQGPSGFRSERSQP